jgi:hypothetical protein
MASIHLSKKFILVWVIYAGLASINISGALELNIDYLKDSDAFEYYFDTLDPGPGLNTLDTGNEHLQIEVIEQPIASVHIDDDVKSRTQNNNSRVTQPWALEPLGSRTLQWQLEHYLHSSQ